jgi:hypothetical protein
MASSEERRRGGSHKGNNGLKGKPSNNKGKKRTRFVPRATSVDTHVQAMVRRSAGDDDLPEDLPHTPVRVYMLRQPWVDYLVDHMLQSECHEVIEEPGLPAMLGHTATEDHCIRKDTDDKLSVTHGWRQNVTVNGQPYRVPKVRRTADRTVRGYHLYMCSYRSGISRAQLALMTRDETAGDDLCGASHICGGTCVNHAIVERNSVNQARKLCHGSMKQALRSEDVAAYKVLRGLCSHTPRCFINPKAHGITFAFIVVE